MNHNDQTYTNEQGRCHKIKMLHIPYCSTSNPVQLKRETSRDIERYKPKQPSPKTRETKRASELLVSKKAKRGRKPLQNEKAAQNEESRTLCCLSVGISSSIGHSKPILSNKQPLARQTLCCHEVGKRGYAAIAAKRKTESGSFSNRPPSSRPISIMPLLLLSNTGLASPAPEQRSQVVSRRINSRCRRCIHVEFLLCFLVIVITR
jgi:hypothetical protein